MRLVFDSFVLLAMVRDETGAARAEELLGGAQAGEHEIFMSVVSLGEVMYSVERVEGLDYAQAALGFVDRSPIQLVDADRELALQAAQLKVATKMGHADCFVATTARVLDAAVVTGDPDFAAIQDYLAIEWLPRGQTP